ncbi:amidohydrolase family protein [Chloroflexota bacterium]
MNKIKNLLAVMENDIGSFFLMIEDYLKKDGRTPLLRDGKLHIGGNIYTKVALTPLMMDFGYKDIKDNPDTYYNELSRKPIVEQVVDVFNGIKKYQNARPNGILEIYPFLGLNTKYYDMDRIKAMLDKYFDNYKGSRQDLNKNMGEFDGDIDHLGSNYFAGIKVYPPLGFDPWPDDKEQRKKVEYLYDYCCQKGIPITAHGSEGGFVVVSKKEQKAYTAISKWDTALGEKKYSKLKLNLAHFPIRDKSLWIFPKKKRLSEILDLVLKYDNVYVDFSYRALNDDYYVALRNLINQSSNQLKTKLKKRILFGSDFTTNLMSIDSYNGYLEIFSRTDSFDPAEKDGFCNANPEQFLFS